MKGAVSDSVSHVKSLVCFFRQIVGAEKELFTKELFFFPAWKINCNADLLPWNVSSSNDDSHRWCLQGITPQMGLC